MFHAVGHNVNARGRSSGLSRHYPHFLGHADWKAALRCGILFCTTACILFVIGVILTWLGVHDVFGESVPITGPILLAVGGLMLLLALRQFYIAHSRKRAQKKALAKGAAKKAVPGADDEEGAALADDDAAKDKGSVDDLNDVAYDETCEKPPLIAGGYGELGGGVGSSGGYYWPAASAQAAITSMAMMVYKDPALTYGPFLSAAHAHSADAYTASSLGVALPLLSAAGSSNGALINPDGAGPSGSYQGVSPLSPASLPGASLPGSSFPGAMAQGPISSGDGSSGGGVIAPCASSPTNLIGAQTSSGSSVPQGETAVLPTTSTTTLQQQNLHSDPQSCSPSGAGDSAPHTLTPKSSAPDPQRIFPSDYLMAYQRSQSSGTSANAGISNLPKPTAFMMLRTLELQETI
ncbi:uncharacterized protein LOC101851672 isoform X2 [Aplysia californica]|uniref:Uncharacterized protein LOC101851672 isoform X2 n=1 Tax=Aplysia californica TaxID=6500 RepID=A0ABM0K3P9_APLCA|nr:uncharacterized protein LOC101851672 isoform X2 [Aplysia californica]